MSSVANTRRSLLLTPNEAHTLPKASTKFLDATWFMPNSPRNAKQEFVKRHIPGAQFFDLDEVASPNELGLKHMMPSPQQFKEACDNFGISREDAVVLYDTHGIFSSPRALFTFKSFGHPNAFVLNGGLPAWLDQGLSVEDGSGHASTTTIKGAYPIPKLDQGIIRSYEEMIGNAERSLPDAELVLDARPTARFTGAAPEPRAGLSSGHMPNSVSIPFNALLATHSGSNEGQATYTTLLPADELRAKLVELLSTPSNWTRGGGVKGSESGADGEAILGRILRGEQPAVASCGSGMTACVIWLALQELTGGAQAIALYDESWTGYAMRSTSRILKSVDET
ncbi:related to 3-mercaptopyruvate sulfurtransferase [Serendipita indica DSM 11827]|uniref:Related to 3-mercaptopyruvate sulfurtransferase n=1 Tax=Serendipita indica (strain DSM 11827) TaxID=1109443 RepID=G4TV23_SERID|nr:related to 3-mercaptopyruvate sulfurtransferase [Serendipita indica DSM 11827]